MLRQAASLKSRIPEIPALDAISRNQRVLMDRLLAEDLSSIFERLIYSRLVESSEVQKLDIEFKKFMFLVGVSDRPIAMIGPKPDAVWHQFILFTHEYASFCQRTVGFFVHHLPDTVKTPVPVEAGENFLSTYERYFGELPVVWLEAMSPETIAYYSNRPLSGKPPTRWSGWTGR